MKGSLIIVSFFIIGTLCGVYHLIPYDFTNSKLSYYALCGLMFCVGISIGNDPNTLKSFRSLNPRLMFLPIMTILGTLAGCAIAGAFMSQRSPLDCMTVGAGFGYYSLSSIFITEYKGPELGTIALLSNIMREIIALLCAPLLVKLFRVKDPMAVGLGIGACSHAMGTAKALELGETEGAMSGLAIGVCGLITVVLSLFLM